MVCVPLTTNTVWADSPGNVLLSNQITRLPKDSVANASQVIALDKRLLVERVSRLPRTKLELILSGLDAVLGR